VPDPTDPRPSLAPAVSELRRRLGRIALCHEWITGAYGSDVTAAAIARALAIGDVFTLVADPDVARQLFSGRVEETWLGRLPLARTRWDAYLPLWSLAWKGVKVQGFDTIITSSHAFSNAVRPSPGSIHVCYCYTPMRYAWEWRSEIRRVPLLLRPLWPAVAAALRAADRRFSRRPTGYVAISEFIRDRIRRAYGRDSSVCYPPVDTEYFTPGPEPRGDFYLCAGRLVAYKRADDAVRAVKSLGRRLIVAGSGPELGRLRRLADPSLVEFLEAVSRDEMRQLMRRTRALLFPGIEDFGIVMVEAQATGTPVIAPNLGGAGEIVRDGETGVLYDELGHRALAQAIRKFEDNDRKSWPSARQNALRFSASSFPERLATAISEVITPGAPSPLLPGLETARQTRPMQGYPAMPSHGTEDPAYAERLQRLQCSWWKGLLDVQRPYRWNLRRLRLGFVIDVGCGIGRNLQNLGGQAVGVDHNPDAVRIAQRRGFDAFLPAAFHASRYAIPDRFDSLLLSHVAEHLPFEETVGLLLEYLQFVRRGGRVVIETPQEFGFRSDHTHVHFVDFRELAHLARAAGLKPQSLYSFPFPRFMGRLFKYNEFVLVARKP
jgi:glycosyltransferase involved in cell wall biosynthesis/SAM-dependent methyltransferase